MDRITNLAFGGTILSMMIILSMAAYRIDTLQSQMDKMTKRNPADFEFNTSVRILDTELRLKALEERTKEYDKRHNLTAAAFGEVSRWLADASKKQKMFVQDTVHVVDLQTKTIDAQTKFINQVFPESK